MLRGINKSSVHFAHSEEAPSHRTGKPGFYDIIDSSISPVRRSAPVLLSPSQGTVISRENHRKFSSAIMDNRQGSALSASVPELPTYGLSKFQQKAGLSAPGTVLTGYGNRNQGLGMVSLRIYTAKALDVPGVEYKSVVATTTTTAEEIVQRTLQRFDDKLDPTSFGLRFVRVKENGVEKKHRLPAVLRRSSSSTLILAPEEVPVLVAERAKGQHRRFELFRIKSKRGSAHNLFAKRSSSNKAIFEVEEEKSGPATEAPPPRRRGRNQPRQPRPATIAGTSTLGTSGSDLMTSPVLPLSPPKVAGIGDGKLNTVSAAEEAISAIEPSPFDTQPGHLINGSLASSRNSSNPAPALLDLGPTVPFIQYDQHGSIRLHCLPQGTTLVGADARRADVAFEGAVGVLAVHVELSVVNGNLALAPYPGAVVYVDGELVTAPQLLADGASVGLGASRIITFAVGGVNNTDKSVRLDTTGMADEFFSSNDLLPSQSYMLAQSNRRASSYVPGTSGTPSHNRTAKITEASPMSPGMMAALTRNRVGKRDVPSTQQQMGAIPLPTPRRQATGSVVSFSSPASTPVAAIHRPFTNNQSVLAQCGDPQVDPDRSLQSVGRATPVAAAKSIASTATRKIASLQRLPDNCTGSVASSDIESDLDDAASEVPSLVSVSPMVTKQHQEELPTNEEPADFTETFAKAIHVQSASERSAPLSLQSVTSGKGLQRQGSYSARVLDLDSAMVSPAKDGVASIDEEQLRSPAVSMVQTPSSSSSPTRSSIVHLLSPTNSEYFALVDNKPMSSNHNEEVIACDAVIHEDDSLNSLSERSSSSEAHVRLTEDDTGLTTTASVVNDTATCLPQTDQEASTSAPSVAENLNKSLLQEVTETVEVEPVPEADVVVLEAPASATPEGRIFNAALDETPSMIDLDASDAENQVEEQASVAAEEAEFATPLHVRHARQALGLKASLPKPKKRVSIAVVSSSSGNTTTADSTAPNHQAALPAADILARRRSAAPGMTSGAAGASKTNKPLPKPRSRSKPLSSAKTAEGNSVCTPNSPTMSTSNTTSKPPATIPLQADVATVPKGNEMPKLSTLNTETSATPPATQVAHSSSTNIPTSIVRSESVAKASTGLRRVKGGSRKAPKSPANGSMKRTSYYGSDDLGLRRAGPTLEELDSRASELKSHSTNKEAVDPTTVLKTSPKRHSRAFLLTQAELAEEGDSSSAAAAEQVVMRRRSKERNASDRSTWYGTEELGLKKTGINLSTLGQTSPTKPASSVTRGPRGSAASNAGLRSTGTSISDIEIRRRVSATLKPATNTGLKRPERLGFADRIKLFQQQTEF